MQGVQVDLVAQPGPEGLDDPGRVVAAAVKPPVHRSLDAAAGRLEQRGHGQSGGGHNQAGALGGQQPAEPKHHGHIAGAEQQAEQRVGQGAAEDAVDVVQPVAQYRRPGGQEQRDKAGTDRRLPQGGVAVPVLGRSTGTSTPPRGDVSSPTGAPVAGMPAPTGGGRAHCGLLDAHLKPGGVRSARTAARDRPVTNFGSIAGFAR